MPLRDRLLSVHASRCRVPWAVLPLVCALEISCATHAARQQVTPSTASRPEPAPAETWVGVVRAIGADQRYVLIETSSALAASRLSEGELLHCRPSGTVAHTATTDVRVSRERHQTLVVADVVAGEPALGAVVYSTPEQKPVSIPVPDPISSVSTAPLSGLSAPRNP